MIIPPFTINITIVVKKKTFQAYEYMCLELQATGYVEITSGSIIFIYSPSPAIRQ